MLVPVQNLPCSLKCLSPATRNLESFTSDSSNNQECSSDSGSTDEPKSVLAMFGNSKDEIDTMLDTFLSKRECLFHVQIFPGLVNNVVEKRSMYPLSTHDAPRLDEMGQFMV